MRSALVQHPGLPRWTIGRMMLLIAVIALALAILREVRGNPFPPFVILSAIVVGLIRGRRHGGNGVTGAIYWGAVASGTVASCLTFTNLQAWSSIETMFVGVLFVFGLGGIYGAILGLILGVALAPFGPMIDWLIGGSHLPSTTVSHSSRPSTPGGDERSSDADDRRA